MQFEVVYHVLEFILACVALALCARVVIRSLVVIARFLKISEFAASFIVMATATSIPELFVGISSSLSGMPAIALGTVIGSNILDLTLVIGTTLLIGRNMRIKRKEVKVDAMWMIGIAILPLLLLYIGGEISRLDGFILICVFLLYERWVFINSRRFNKPVENGIQKWDILVSSGIIILAIVGLYLSSHWAVDTGLQISADFAIPPILVGVIMLSFGTSLPELAFETASALKGHGDMALGDVIGSVITNSSLVLGVVALIFPITANMLYFAISGLFMIAVAIIFAAFIESEHLTWKVGAGLILLYIFFLIVTMQLEAVIS